MVAWNVTQRVQALLLDIIPLSLPMLTSRFEACDDAASAGTVPHLSVLERAQARRQHLLLAAALHRLAVDLEHDFARTLPEARPAHGAAFGRGQTHLCAVERRDAVHEPSIRILRVL